MAERLPQISKNEEFWQFRSGGVNIPYEYNGKKYAVVIYAKTARREKRWLLKYYGLTSQRWRNKRNFDIDVTSVDTLQESIRQAISSLEWAWNGIVDREHVVLTRKHLFARAWVTTHTREATTRVASEVVSSELPFIWRTNEKTWIIRDGVLNISYRNKTKALVLYRNPWNRWNVFKKEKVWWRWMWRERISVDVSSLQAFSQGIKDLWAQLQDTTASKIHAYLTSEQQDERVGARVMEFVQRASVAESIWNSTKNEDFWELPSGGINIPYQVEKPGFSRPLEFAFVIYGQWTGVTMYKSYSTNKWRQWRSFKLKDENGDHTVSLEAFQAFMNKKINSIRDAKGGEISKKYAKLTYEYLFEETVSRSTTPDRIAPVTSEEKVTYTSNSQAELKYEWKKLVFKKLPKWVQVEWGSKTEILYFDDINQLSFRLGRWLNQEIGLERKKIRKELNEIWNRLNLKTAKGRRELVIPVEPSVQSRIERPISTSQILSFPVWQYFLDQSPITYLLARNDNTWAYYCLSFVQEAYDIMFGPWSAKKAWLYDARFAQSLSFDSSEGTVYNSNFPPLKPGMIIRMWSGMTHIGIVLPNNKIGHIVGSTFHVDDSLSAINWGSVRQVIVPNNLWSPQVTAKMSPRTYKSWSWLERVGYVIKRELWLRFNQAYIDEAIYQLNKEKFKLVRNRWGTTVVLKSTTKLRLPSQWQS